MELFSVLESTVRSGTPLVLASMAGLFSERSGVVDISLEGKMLAAAFASAAFAYAFHSPWIGLMAGIGASVFFAMLHGFISVTYSGNQLISGMAINIIVSGITPVVGLAWFQLGGSTPGLDEVGGRFRPIIWPGAEAVKDVPIAGQFYYHVISGHSILVYLTVLIVPIVAWVLYRSRFGLRLRAVGENPHAADTAGINVARVRYVALFWGGVLCGISGTFLSVALNGSFGREMSGGRGFMALAALIFGKWRPVPAMIGCLMFAFLEAVQYQIQGQSLPIVGEIPTQLIQAIPYVLTVLLLAGFVGRAVAPKAIGIPFVKSR